MKQAEMPVLFLGHGSPINAVENNAFSRGWRALGERLPRPSAVLCVSAHWQTAGTAVHISRTPRTIHDFYGFPKELYSVTYPCPGAPELAERLRRLVRSVHVRQDRDWGLDHGAWSVIKHLFPKADVPVFQLSMDEGQPAAFHYKLGRELAPLRDEGVLMVASGNIVHNLGLMSPSASAAPYDWTLAFDSMVRKLLESGDVRPLVEYETLGAAAELSIPTPEHYWPLLYALGMRREKDRVSFPVEGTAHGSLSMRCVMFSRGSAVS